jgi:hypothetical protein
MNYQPAHFVSDALQLRTKDIAPNSRQAVLWRRTCMLPLLTTMAAILLGCASIETRWQEAQRRNSIAGYEQFIRAYPKSALTQTARERVEKLRFDQATQKGTEEAYKGFLQDHPSGAFADRAQDALVHLVFTDASRANTVGKYESFIARFPQHALAGQAREKVRSLRFDQAKKAESVAAIEEFLTRYQQGSDADALRQELPTIREWEPKKNLGNLIIRLNPEIKANLFGIERKPSPTLKADMAEIRRLLEAGVDPNSVRIADFEPPTEESTTSTVGGTVFIRSSRSSGSPGKVVPANIQGLSVLDYCKTNNLTEAYELLKSHGAN